MILITPKYLHIHVLPNVRHGCPPTSTVNCAGIHAAVIGVHGWGVSTPSAAAVAEATAGFVSVVHIPNGPMFTNGAPSPTTHAGTPPMSVVKLDVPLRTLGIVPNEQIVVPPVTHATINISSLV